MSVGVLLIFAATAGAQGGAAAVVQRFERDRDFRGFVQSIATRPGDPTAWIATKSRLYRLESGQRARLVEVVSQPAPGQRLLLAPRGGAFVWLVPASDGLSKMRGFALPTGGGAPTPVPTPDLAFADLHLGPDLNVLVTGTPVADPHSGRGPYRYVLWDGKANPRRELESRERRQVVIGPRGESIALIGEDDTTILDEAGELIWEADGHFRAGALAARGKVVILNSGEPGQADQLVLRGRGQGLRSIRSPAPVHDVGLDPDGDRAVVVASEARYFMLDTDSGELEEGPGIAPGGSGAVITDIALLEDGSILAGLLMAQGEGGPDAPSPARVVIVSPDGALRFRRDLVVPERVAGTPAVHADPGSSFVFAWTRDELLVIGVD